MHGDSGIQQELDGHNPEERKHIHLRMTLVRSGDGDAAAGARVEVEIGPRKQVSGWFCNVNFIPGR
jgi:hypothetical protein